MGEPKQVTLLYGADGMTVDVPADAVVLTGQDVSPVADPDRAVAGALADPIASPPLAELIAAKQPQTVAITVSDITRPVPNKQFLPAMLKTLNDCGIADCQIVIIIGTGMHP
jgi:nickel-dependent lactate racemase